MSFWGGHKLLFIATTGTSYYAGLYWSGLVTVHDELFWVDVFVASLGAGLGLAFLALVIAALIRRQ
ncbi:MAG: hypothetical protein P4M09_22020 [Devosia sp.]|nr:hypothetical protein [Devosia sp.]